MYVVTSNNMSEAQSILAREFKCSIYQSEYGWGFTQCDSDCYDSELDATVAAVDYYFSED